MEDKRKICSLLLPVIQATFAGRDVVDLEYCDNVFTDDASVRIVFASGRKKKVDVTCDSGMSMVLDILRWL